MQDGYNTWRSSLDWSGNIPHYYGDYVRSLFIAMAILSFVAMPLWGSLVPLGIALEVGAALLLVLLAGLTTPRSLYVMLINATVSAVSVVLLETFAITLGTEQSMQLFLAREAGVILMLAALYFSVKTARAMLSGKLGRKDTPLEFDENATPGPAPVRASHPSDETME